MIRIARRRNPNVEIVVAPCAVQGADAAGEIVEAIDRLNRDARAEVLLVGRGGGSIEDLWAFNEEIVARAIANSRIPVVSCVGHETDFTIADFVADLRAATPSMAAEVTVPVAAELRRNLRAAMGRVTAGLRQGNRLRRSELMRVCASGALRDPARALIRPRAEAVSAIWERCRAAEEARSRDARNRLHRTGAKLDALNPSGVLERGYAYLTDGKSVLSSVAELAPGMRVDVRMRDGSVRAEILDQNHSEASDGR